MVSTSGLSLSMSKEEDMPSSALSLNIKKCLNKKSFERKIVNIFLPISFYISYSLTVIWCLAGNSVGKHQRSKSYRWCTAGKSVGK